MTDCIDWLMAGIVMGRSSRSAQCDYALVLMTFEITDGPRLASQ